ncbi:MacB family efflux pump subunit [Oleispirillum naphthae]|uniref:MacB family efflux pump subunit n=1 Tax=Oleispirillum naphthae TaxID=2838853 RepID=UPI00308228D2
MTAAPLIELSGVEKVFPAGEAGVRALAGVDLAIRAGEYVAIMGASGSGKSTLMTLIGCLDRPSGGTYRLLGRDVSALSADDLAALRRDTFGFVFQRYHLLADATALENVTIPAIYAGMKREEREARGRALLGALGLGERAHHRPGQLSGGQQQRVSIARALVNDPQVILADEPTGALDSQSGGELMDRLAALHAEGRTVLVVTHDAAVAARAQRVIRISDGRIVSDSAAAAPAAPAHAATLREGAHPGWRDNLEEAVRMAGRSLKANPFRTALTLLGVIIGVAAVVAMLAIGSGSQREVMARIQAMGTNLLMVRPGAPGTHRADIITLTRDDAGALVDLPGVDLVVPERHASQTMRYGNIDHKADVYGVTAGFPQARDWGLSVGIFFDAADVESHAAVAVLGKTVADHLFGEGEGVGAYIVIHNVPFLVIGILEPKGASTYGSDLDDMVLVPLTTGLTRLFGGGHVSSMMIWVSDAARIGAAQRRVRAALLARHNGIEDFQIRNTTAVLQAAEKARNSLTVLLGTVAAISLLVGGIGVMNIMLVSVSERTGEIGIRMATGARRLDVQLQFNAEAVVVCGLGGLFGIVIGLFAAWLCRAAGMPVVFSPWPSAMAFACAFATGLVFGYLPARKASRLDPVTALASE